MLRDLVGLRRRRRRFDHNRGRLGGSRLVSGLGLRGGSGRGSVDGLAIRANDDGDDGRLPDDIRVASGLATSVRDSESSARESKHTKRNVGMHFEFWFGEV